MSHSSRRPLPDGLTPFLRLNDLTVWLNVSRSTIFTWIQQGRLPAGIRIGGVTLYDPRAIADALGLDKEVG